MRALLKVSLVLVIGLVVIGFYRGWFGLSRPQSDAAGNKVNVNLSVDKNKIKADVNKAEQKVKEGVRQLEGKGKPETK